MNAVGTVWRRAVKTICNGVRDIEEMMRSVEQSGSIAEDRRIC